MNLNDPKSDEPVKATIDPADKHLVGTGMGLVGGAVAGAALGSAIGPLGTLTGAVLGAGFGTVAGRGIAEGIVPDAERNEKDGDK